MISAFFYASVKNWIISLKGEKIYSRWQQAWTTHFCTILSDGEIGLKHIGETLDVMKNISAKRATRCLNADEKRACVKTSRIYPRFKEDSKFPKEIITMGETIFTILRQNNSRSGCPRSKSTEKFLLQDFGTVLVPTSWKEK